MKLDPIRLSAPLLGMLLWILSTHVAIFSNATAQYYPLPSLNGFESNAISSSTEAERDLVDILEEITPKELNGTVKFAENVIGYMKRLENNLLWSNIKVTDGTPSHGMLISFGPEPEALNRGRDALIALKASSQLLNIYCDRLSKASSKKITYQDCAQLMSRFTFYGTSLTNTCKMLDAPCEEDQHNSPYRTINGSCNNVEKGHQGESFTGYSRLLYADYSDGVHEPRRSVTKKPLPNARAVVTTLVKFGDKPAKKSTLALMQWSQFIEHDLGRSATAKAIHTDSSIECCSEEGDNLSPRYVHPFCSPIYVTDDKQYAKQGVNCLSFVRSIPAVRSDCSFGASDQVNQATHYLDGSQIYGSTFEKTRQLRSFVDGKMATSELENRTYLPLSTHPTQDCQIFSTSSACFESGDARVNFQPQLALMHTLWYREHNRIAEALAQFNPHWDDEKLYQETRRIVIAEIQKITYWDWHADATVSNAFATAVMRSIKSLSDGVPRFYDEDRVANESIFMRNYFNNPAVLRQQGVLDALARGLATQPSQRLDIYFARDLINKLYTNGRFGFDVLSFDLQRGRDHGLPAYTAYRRLCGLREAKNFVDFIDFMREEDILALQQVYASPDDVDLMIGGLLEKPKGDTLFGPTFSCILADQMLRTRKGDRYFYDNQDQPKPFTKDQLGQIQRSSLARIMCDNGDSIKKMQPRVFEKIGKSNPLVECNEIPKLDLSLWQEIELNSVRY